MSTSSNFSLTSTSQKIPKTPGSAILRKLYKAKFNPSNRKFMLKTGKEKQVKKIEIERIDSQNDNQQMMLEQTCALTPA